MFKTFGSVSLVCMAAGIGLSYGLPAAQQQQPPVFRAGIDLLTVQATVLDGDGQPVSDLKPSDFDVQVDGRPRKVLFARFQGTDAHMAAGSAATVSVSAAPVTNTATATGRVVLFVVDRDSIKPGNEKVLLETASHVLDSLTSADSVGLIGIPTLAVELTRNHAKVREVLQKMTGTEPRLLTASDRHLTWDEAAGFERGDRMTISTVVQRECSITDTKCPRMLQEQAREILQIGRGHVRTTLAVLEDVAKRLETVRGPKHVIFISGGKGFDMELAVDYRQFARRAAAAQLVLYAVHVDQPSGDVSGRRVSGSAFGGRDMASGLMAMAGTTGGGYFMAVARATGVFDRIRTEIGNFYELGIESTASDADGKPHDLDVEVTRPGLSVRAREQILLPASVSSPSTDHLVTLLQQPIDLAEIPLTIGAYTTRGSDPSSLRVLLSAEVGASPTRGPAEWAFVVSNADGKVVGDGRHELDTSAPGPWNATASVQLPPGRYRLKVAVSDADRRAGVLDVPLTVGLRAAGPLQMSDIVLGTTAAGRLQPRFRVPAGAPLVVLIELLSGEAERLAASRAVVEIIPAGTAEPVQRHLMAARSGGSDAVLLNEATIDTTKLAPGRYTASVIALVDNQPAGRVVRVFDVSAR